MYIPINVNENQNFVILIESAIQFFLIIILFGSTKCMCMIIIHRNQSRNCLSQMLNFNKQNWSNQLSVITHPMALSVNIETSFAATARMW
jgi:Tfp pilus assembly ATPase PilU